MSRIAFRTWTIPIALLLFCLLSFGLLIPMIGLYWDDWPTLWQLHMFGPGAFREAFSVDRPFLAWLFMLTTPIIGESVKGWQLFGIFTLWASCLSLWWMLRMLWPGRTTQCTWVAFLFAVYPSFSQHYISVTYSHVYLIYAIFFTSMGSMIAAIRQPERFWLWMILSWISSIFTVFTAEYFFGLELLRPIFLWIALQDQQPEPRRRLPKIARYWSPYAVIMVTFLIWRTLIYETQRGEVQIFNRLLADPLVAALELGKTILTDIFEVSALAWGQTIDKNNFIRQEPYILAAIIVMIIVPATLSFIYLLKLNPQGATREDSAGEGANRWAIQAILIGSYALLIGGWPFWATYLPMMLVFPWDRFTLPMLLGASILIIGLIDLIFGRRLWKVLILSVLIGLAVGMHFHTGLEYRKYWDKQRRLFWELTWRVPGLEPGTILLTPQLPYLQYSDNSLTAPLNWIYAPGRASRQLDYLMLSIETRTGDILTSFEEGTPVHLSDRNLTFNGSTSQTLVFFHEPPRCVTVVEPGVNKSPPNKEFYIDEALALSKPDLIVVDPQNHASPPAHIFGAEPTDKWCYYFEKADLARQIGDWSLIPELGDQAYKHLQDLYSVNAPELIPFIQGYALAGNWEQALDWTRIALDLKPRARPLLCATWQEFPGATEPGPQRSEALEAIVKELECELPEQ